MIRITTVETCNCGCRRIKIYTEPIQVRDSRGTHYESICNIYCAGCGKNLIDTK